MDLLKKKLATLVESLSKEEKEKVRSRLENLISVYPFNEYEFILASLLGLEKISFDEYLEIRDEYIARNMYLYIFEISAPRGFGEQWAQGHLLELVPSLVKPTKKIDNDYSGQYDFFLPVDDGKGIRIEVKASRAVDFDSRDALYVKALALKSEKPFDMNFQQVKPGCCDVFVWVAVWRDTIKYWVLSSKEVASNRYYSKGQHRGNVGEGQIHITKDNIDEFRQYEAKSNKLLDAIKDAYLRQLQS